MPANFSSTLTAAELSSRPSPAAAPIGQSWAPGAA